MLELKDVSLQVGSAPDDLRLLAEVGARFPRNHFGAIVGPSGCGKTTLLKVIAGLREPTLGHVAWDGRNLAEEGDLDPHEIGYVPQFSIAYDLLTVAESMHATFRLRVGRVDAETARGRIARILGDVGLVDIEDRRVGLLSGGQKRRLALALEMVSSPHLLLCDEVTSGLDPKAEDEIVKLMRHLSRTGDRIVLSVTHSLRHLPLYDSVLVLYQGTVAYHGAAETLFHYFGVEKPDDFFPRLAARKPDEWHRSWLKHRAAYSGANRLDHLEPARAFAGSGTRGEPSAGLPGKERRQQSRAPSNSEAEAPGEELEAVRDPGEQERVSSVPSLDAMPSVLAQLRVLLARRWKLFFRDRGQVLLQLALLFGFPFLVVIFALDGLPQLKSLGDQMTGNVLERMQTEFAQQAEGIKAGSLVSGLIMFQVILLALMGSNNAAREIAAERLIFEKEKFAGLRPSAYVASKALFLGVLVLAQSLWMGIFVQWIVRFPGEFPQQLLLLILVNAALTAICLGISSFMKTAEQASLVSVYLVGFQLPLSGAVLALPAFLNAVTRPFIASYWGWSGFLQSMRDTRSYDAVLKVTQTHLSPVPLCVWVLVFHVIIGLFIAYSGSRNSRWE